MRMTAKPFVQGGVLGFLHEPRNASGEILVLTHGAGSNANAPFLVALGEAFSDAGIAVLRYDLPFRQQRPHGSPNPSTAARDREGLREAVAAAREITGGRAFLGGHSYGGRQATMAAAEHPDLAAALLLLSYPLHPPGKPENLRTAHLPGLRIPSMFVHGSRDPFGSIDEMRAALALIPARTHLVEVEGGAHDLGGRRRGGAALLAAAVVQEFVAFVKT
jgi:predicted alpha/beta-hydrolase family hydrolase